MSRDRVGSVFVEDYGGAVARARAAGVGARVRTRSVARVRARSVAQEIGPELC